MASLSSSRSRAFTSSIDRLCNGHPYALWWKRKEDMSSSSCLFTSASTVSKPSTRTQTTTLIIHMDISNWNDEKKHATNIASLLLTCADIKSRTTTDQSSPVMICQKVKRHEKKFWKKKSPYCSLSLKNRTPMIAYRHMSTMTIMKALPMAGRALMSAVTIFRIDGMRLINRNTRKVRIILSALDPAAGSTDGGNIGVNTETRTTALSK
mmetsp:Transcript_21893/g.32131  ORF Transcript_21893/g.32131 Transcript_21893/m.32131 type:complete len:209 (+) Transcript_21893:121-747(+)